MNTAELIYLGELRCDALHVQSASHITTDAPTDNHGKGANFSPTDLVATALGACMLTTIAIKTKDTAINIDGSKMFVKKIMTATPRKIGQVEIVFEVKNGKTMTEEHRRLIEHIAHNCPVALSLHPNLVQQVEFSYV